MSKNKNRWITNLSWLAVVAWMSLIFLLSSQVADTSNELSKGLTQIVLEIINKIYIKNPLSLNELNHLLRKSAHFMAYLILGFLVLNALRQAGYKGLRYFGLALLICVVYAVSDEIHQSFVPGRGPQVKDVFIDSMGALTGIGFYGAVRSLIRKDLD